MHLYGDVGKTGFYESGTHRYRIAIVFKYLLSVAGASAAMPELKRWIAANAEGFANFTNGLLGNTTSLFTDAVVELQEIRRILLLRRDAAAWADASSEPRTDEERAEMEERLEGAKRTASRHLLHSNENLSMIRTLTADIRGPFLTPELRKLLAAMLNSVLGKLTVHGLSLKIPTAQKGRELNWRPVESLVDTLGVYLNFCDHPEFVEAVAGDAFYVMGGERMFANAIRICRRQRPPLLDEDALRRLERLAEGVEAAKRRNEAEDEALGEAPEEFTCAVMATLMEDPVRLPSGKHVDRSFIVQHLRNSDKDPFNNRPMTIEDAKPAPELRARIEAWKAGRGGGE
jgi:ubiquitin conjugation factor E4 B